MNDMAHRLVVLARSMDSDTKKISATSPLQVLPPGSLIGLRDGVWEDRLVIQEGFAPEPVQRLLVLVPENDFDENQLSQCIWKLAAPRALAVSYVGLLSLPETEPLLRRRLATIAGNTSDRDVIVQTKIVTGEDWIEAIQETLQPGDLVVCLEDHKITNWGVLRRSVGMAISNSLKVPVYIITGISIDPTSSVVSWGKEAAVWLIAIGTMGIFAWMQFLIDRAYQGWQSIILTMIVVTLEILLLWKLSEIMS